VVLVVSIYFFFYHTLLCFDAIDLGTGNVYGL